MALGDNTLQAARGNGERGRKPYLVSTVVDFATALSDKGSALAANDIIPAIAVKKGTCILNAGIEVDTLQTAATALTLDLGTGVDADVFVDGFTATSAAAETYAQNAAAFQPVMCVADDNIDLKIATLTGTLSTGKYRVWAILMDCDDIGDMTANEVDRDTLA
jgi:hypothetical protein